MPTYEYECDRCRRVFEVRQRISAAPLTTCDACGGPLRRLLSPAPFILKGGGWYVTDYPSESRKKALQSEKNSDKSAPGGAADKPGGGASGDTGKGSADGAKSPGEGTKSSGAPAASSATKTD